MNNNLIFFETEFGLANKGVVNERNEYWYKAEDIEKVSVPKSAVEMGMNDLILHSSENIILPDEKLTNEEYKARDRGYSIAVKKMLKWLQDYEKRNADKGGETNE